MGFSGELREMVSHCECFTQLGITLFSCAPPIDFFIMSQSKIFEISVDALTAVNQINRMVRLL